MPQSYDTAAKLLRGAAERGDRAAENRLAVMYDQGLGVPKDHRRARGLLQQSAAQGYAPAMVGLGRIYVEGIGVPRDRERGYALIRAALDVGIPSELRELAFFELGAACARLDKQQSARAEAAASEIVSSVTKDASRPVPSVRLAQQSACGQ